MLGLAFERGSIEHFMARVVAFRFWILPVMVSLFKAFRLFVVALGCQYFTRWVSG